MLGFVDVVGVLGGRVVVVVVDVGIVIPVVGVCV